MNNRSFKMNHRMICGTAATLHPFSTCNFANLAKVRKRKRNSVQQVIRKRVIKMAALQKLIYLYTVHDENRLLQAASYRSRVSR